MEAKNEVILIGGSPMSGKTTVASKIASKLGYPCISTDDLWIVANELTTKETHPQLHYMNKLKFMEYYLSKEKEELFTDINNCHKALWPAIKAVIEAHIKWNGSAVIEGYALYPKEIAKMRDDNIKPLWLICENDVFSKRYDDHREGFMEGCEDPVKMKDNYVGRSNLHNKLIFKGVEKYDFPKISINLASQKDSIIGGGCKLLKLHARAAPNSK